jgi:hypothetical protein
MGTFVRDRARLGLPPLPPSARSWERIEALSAATEIEVVDLVEALELTLLLADREPLKYERAALRWHARFVARRPAWMCVRATRCCTSRSDPETPEM